MKEKERRHDEGKGKDTRRGETGNEAKEERWEMKGWRERSGEE